MTIFVWCLDVFFSFFKQKTAYEMRISDWRSDVCSSDLRAARTDPFDALAEALRATGLYPYCIGLFDGKIVDLERETRGGFAVGRAVLDAFGGPGRMEVDFQTAHRVAREDGQIKALVPDLNTLLDRANPHPYTPQQPNNA